MLWSSSKSTTEAAFAAVKRLHRRRHCQHQDVLVVATSYYHTNFTVRVVDTDSTVSHLIASKYQYRQYQQKRYQHHQSPHQHTVLKENEEATEDPALTWARSNPAEAQACITPPSFPSFPSCHHDDDNNNDDRRRYNNRYHSLEEYLKWRRWTIAVNWKKWNGGGSSSNNDDEKTPSTKPNDLNDDLELEHKHKLKHKQKMIQGYKMTMISHVLSTPLTLALQIEQYSRMIMMTNSNDEDDDDDDDESSAVVQSRQFLKICCVGARAEACLPDMYWRELLNVVRTNSQSQSTSTSTLKSQPLSVSIDFIGPDIPPMRKERVVTYSHSIDGTETESTLTLRGLYRGFFHDYFSTTSDDDDAAGGTNGDSKSKIDDYDFVIFFNPGFGHPNLQNGWNETLRTILFTDDDGGGGDGFSEKNKAVSRSSRVLFFTAHSRIDADRDAKLLKKRFGIDAKYTENPFASRIQYLDPCHKTDGAEHIIRPNQYMAFCVV